MYRSDGETGSPIVRASDASAFANSARDSWRSISRMRRRAIFGAFFEPVILDSRLG